MIRPEVRARLMRWREALIGTAFLPLGLWLWLAQSGLLALFGAVALAVGAFLVFSGLRAGRFRSDGQSPGVVQVVEGRITYMGPVHGGLVNLDTLTEITFRRTDADTAFWHLAQEGAPPLTIPVGAVGADKLLDALAPLPDLDTGAMVRAVQTRTPQTITVWRRTGVRALT